MTFLTEAFQTLSGSQLGLSAGAETFCLEPLKRCTVYVPSLFLLPLSLNFMSETPLLAAFSAACLGDLPVKTASSLFPFLRE